MLLERHTKDSELIQRSVEGRLDAKHKLIKQKLKTKTTKGDPEI